MQAAQVGLAHDFCRGLAIETKLAIYISFPTIWPVLDRLGTTIELQLMDELSATM